MGHQTVVLANEQSKLPESLPLQFVLLSVSTTLLATKKKTIWRSSPCTFLRSRIATPFQWLKREWERNTEHAGALTSDNVLNVFQLALLCDALRLGLIYHRRITGGLKSVTASET